MSVSSVTVYSLESNYNMVRLQYSYACSFHRISITKKGDQGQKNDLDTYLQSTLNTTFVRRIFKLEKVFLDIYKQTFYLYQQPWLLKLIIALLTFVTLENYKEFSKCNARSTREI